LKEAVENTIILSDAVSCYRETKMNRGRLETRETYLYSREDNMDKGWESVNTIVFVRRECWSAKKEHKTESFYISDLKTTDAKYIAQLVRSHWYIENKLHYTKDVIMLEDEKSTKNKNAAANLALLRDFAFNILKNKNKSIKQAIETFQNYNVKELLNIIDRT
jgi:transposase